MAEADDRRPDRRVRAAAQPCPDAPGIDPALTADMVRRFRVVAQIAVGVLFLTLIIDAVGTQLGALRMPLSASAVLPRALGISASLAVWWLLRSGRVSPARALSLSPIYEVGMALVISYTEQVLRSVLGGPMSASWVAVWIVLVRVFLPHPPRTALATSMASTLTLPAGAALISLTGVPIQWGAVLVTMAITLCAALAAVSAALLVRRLQLEVTQARELGSYELGEELGRGGMGVVWRARHRLLKRDAAIKVISAEALAATDRASALCRFEREARITAALRSRNTIEVYDFGLSDDGSFYYVMELLDGLDLRQLIQSDGAQPPARVAHLLIQACRSLGEAHAVGLVHRDVKPANLFLCRCGPELDVVKVMDFGLVSDRGDAPQAESNRGEPGAVVDPALTLQGTLCGTPGFVAPEVACGAPADSRSDVYALGCVAYSLLAAKPPLQRPTAMELVRAHIDEVPRPPSAALGRPIPDALETIVMSCLAKDPSQRPTDGRDLEQRLVRCALDGWTADDAERWWAARRPDASAASAPTRPLTPVAEDRYLDAPTR